VIVIYFVYGLGYYSGGGGDGGSWRAGLISSTITSICFSSISFYGYFWVSFASNKDGLCCFSTFSALISGLLIFGYLLWGY
jgi:hypothetical protein